MNPDLRNTLWRQGLLGGAHFWYLKRFQEVTIDVLSLAGRPVDVQPLLDGSLLVSDDLAGAVYRVTYNKASVPDGA